MNSKASGDPLAVMSHSERRKWRQAERRVVREHNAQQLATLRSLAATAGGLTSLVYPDSGRYAISAEFMIAGKRIQAGRVHRGMLSTLTQTLAAKPTIALMTASRYGPHWVLTFELATAPLVVLIDRLRILPDRHGDSAPLPAPTAPVDRRVAPYGTGSSAPPTLRTATYRHVWLLDLHAEVLWMPGCRGGTIADRPPASDRTVAD